MNREQTIRDAAYAIWEAEGRPTGRAQQHWLQAEKQVAESTQAPAKKKAASAPKTSKAAPPAAKPNGGSTKKTTRTKKA